MNLLVGNKYKLENKIGDGSFGSVYQGTNIRSREKVAIKIEPSDSNCKSLKNETRVYQYLNNCQGVPMIRWFGTELNVNYMVIDYLGISLTEMVKKNGHFNIKQLCFLAIQMLDILQSIHNKGMIHRDIKPDNFLTDPISGINKIYLIDYGVCKTFIQSDKKLHIEMGKTKALIGTPNFASINAHHFLELSRRDDLESLGYVFIFLYLGYLPWSLNDNNSRENIMIQKKKLIENENNKNDLNIPKEILTFLKFVIKLDFKYFLRLIS